MGRFIKAAIGAESGKEDGVQPERATCDSGIQHHGDGGCDIFAVFGEIPSFVGVDVQVVTLRQGGEICGEEGPEGLMQGGDVGTGLRLEAKSVDFCGGFSLGIGVGGGDDEAGRNESGRRFVPFFEPHRKHRDFGEE